LGPFDHVTGRTPESPARRVPRPTGLDRTSSSSRASRPFLRARAQLAHIQPGTMGSRLKSLGPVRSVCVSVLREEITDRLPSMASLHRAQSPCVTPPRTSCRGRWSGPSGYPSRSVSAGRGTGIPAAATVGVLRPSVGGVCQTSRMPDTNSIATRTLAWKVRHSAWLLAVALAKLGS